MLLFIPLLTAALAVSLSPNFLPARAHVSSYCRSNCKNIATALKMYAEDNGGRYPTVLSHLTRGNYLKLIPTCPAAGSATYAVEYQTNHKPDRFSFCCAGNNHAKIYSGFSTNSNNYPQYNSEYGLQEHP